MCGCKNKKIIKVLSIIILGYIKNFIWAPKRVFADYISFKINPWRICFEFELAKFKLTCFEPVQKTAFSLLTSLSLRDYEPGSFLTTAVCSLVGQGAKLNITGSDYNL